MIKTSHASGKESLHAIENRKRLKKKSGNSTYANGETDRSNLKNSPRGSILRSRFFNQTKETEPLERSQITLEKWVLERLCVLK